MGWLDLLFGKGTSRKAAKASKAVSKITSALNAPSEKASSKKSAMPKIDWQKSEKGNDTAEVDGYRITIFKRDDEWNYCVVEILDEEDLVDGLEEDPQFGDGYPTKAAARKAALEEL